MARPPRQKLDFTPQSLLEQLQRLHAASDDLRQNAMRDYREIKQLTNTGDEGARAANAVNLETARNNALRSAREAITQQADLIKIQAGIYTAINKTAEETPAAAAAGGTLTDDKKKELRELAKALQREEKKNAEE